MKRLALFLAMLMLAGNACAEDLVSIRELRANTPARWQACVAGVQIDAPIILPEAETLPALLLRQRTELKHAVPSGATDFWGTGSLPGICFAVGWDRTFRHSVPSSQWGIAQLPWDADTPEGNDYPMEQAMALAQKALLDAAGLQAGVDYHPTLPTACSAYYLVNPAGEVLTADGPLNEPGFDRGGWAFSWPLLLDGQWQVAEHPHSFLMEVDGAPEPWPWDGNTARVYVVDDGHWELTVTGCLAVVRVLEENVLLADWPQIQHVLEAQIIAGRLVQIDSIELCALGCYTPPDGSTDVQWALPFWRVMGTFAVSPDETRKMQLHIRAQSGQMEDPLSRDPQRCRAEDVRR